jgi:two-component system alkaline phosphatase synthesis response regulator PhoP
LTVALRTRSKRNFVLHQLKPRILAIDDETVVGDLLRALLNQTGEYIVEVETDAFRALQRARVFKPDLLIMDVNMPGRSGVEIARMIRNEPWLCHRPILFFTGMVGAERTALKSASEGPTKFLLKGEHPRTILATVEALVEERLSQYRAALAAANRRSPER